MGIQTHKVYKNSGSAMVELLVVCPVLLFMGFGTAQVGLIYHAKSILNYATFEAARAGAVNHAKIEVIRNELGLRMAPVYGGDGSAKKAALSIMRAKAAASDTSVTKIDLISPSKAAFENFGIKRTIDGTSVTAIPNSHLRYRDASTGSSGQSVQEANLLTIKVTYGFRLRLPVLDAPVPLWEPSMRLIMTKLDPKRAHYYARGLLPITAKATVRMQSEAHYDVAAYSDSSNQTPTNTTVPPVVAVVPAEDVSNDSAVQSTEHQHSQADENLNGPLAQFQPSDTVLVEQPSESNLSSVPNTATDIDVADDCVETINGLPANLPIVDISDHSVFSCAQLLPASSSQWSDGKIDSDAIFSVSSEKCS